ncbi:hypothetical protein D3C73_1349270 [compost metagenome]
MYLNINGIVQEQADCNCIFYSHLAAPFVFAVSGVYEFVWTELELKVFWTGVENFIGPDGFLITPPEVQKDLGDSIAICRWLKMNVHNKVGDI